MIERRAVLPLSTDDLWETLTDPDEVAQWFGADVRWDLEPGGAIQVRDDEDGDRDGTVEQVDPGRSLRFTWWPCGQHDRASEVTYRIEPDPDGALLIITERPLALPVATHWDIRVVALSRAALLVRC